MKLWEPSKCCCFQLRTGSIIIAVLFLVGGCFSLLGGVKNLIIGFENEDAMEICEDTADEGDCIQQMRKFHLGINLSSIVMASFHIIFSSLLLHGILKQKTAYFIPLMTVYAIQISLMILFSAIVLIIMIVLQVSFAILLVLGILLGLMIFMETYFLLVIRAHYYEIKRVKGHVHTALEDQNPEVPAYPGQVPPYPGQVPPYPDQVPPYPGKVPPYSGQVPPYPGNEAPSYPGCDAPLYPDLEKAPK